MNTGAATLHAAVGEFTQTKFLMSFRKNLTNLSESLLTDVLAGFSQRLENTALGWDAIRDVVAGEAAYLFIVGFRLNRLATSDLYRPPPTRVE
jgi:hypothetical protein